MCWVGEVGLVWCSGGDDGAPVRLSGTPSIPVAYESVRAWPQPCPKRVCRVPTLRLAGLFTFANIQINEHNTNSSNQRHQPYFRKISNRLATAPNTDRTKNSHTPTNNNPSKHNGANAPKSSSPGEQYSEPKPNQKTSRPQRSHNRTEASINRQHPT